MSYIDEAFYNDTFKGEPVDTADFPSLSMRAEEIVEEMTMYRLTPTSFLAMPEDMQSRVKRAVCAQIEYLEANGGSDMDNGADFQSAGLGKFNYSKLSDISGIYAPRASRYLFPTGLLYRGGGCL